MEPALQKLLPAQEAILGWGPAYLAEPLLRWAAFAPSASLHEDNFLLMFQSDPVEVGEAMAEAWSWLKREGLLVRSVRQNNGPIYVVSRTGRRLLESDSFQSYVTTTLSSALLHPRIKAKAWPTFLHGDYETAVFSAFKEVEIAVRDKSGSSESGDKLMREAFKVGGPLADPSLPESEQLSLAHLFAGAFGAYRNATGHRTVVFDSSDEPSELLVLASHLMRVVERVSIKP